LKNEKKGTYHLYIDELAILILEQRRHYRVYHILHTRSLYTHAHKDSSSTVQFKKGKEKVGEKEAYPDRIVTAKVVLINSLQPPNIIVRVGYQMNVNLARNDAPCGVVSYVLGFHRQPKPPVQIDC
jgi:hypothetical protein